jgi:hypothetical protein
VSWLLGLLEDLLAPGLSRQEGAPPMALTTYYRTRDGRADYHFSIERQTDGTYRTYILSQPNYGSRATGAHETHRLTGGSRHYVCWDRPLRSEEEATR